MPSTLKTCGAALALAVVAGLATPADAGSTGRDREGRRAVAATTTAPAVAGATYERRGLFDWMNRRRDRTAVVGATASVKDTAPARTERWSLFDRRRDRTAVAGYTASAAPVRTERWSLFDRRRDRTAVVGATASVKDAAPARTERWSLFDRGRDRTAVAGYTAGAAPARTERWSLFDRRRDRAPAAAAVSVKDATTVRSDRRDRRR